MCSLIKRLIRQKMAHVFSQNGKQDFRFTDFPFYYPTRRHIPEICNLHRRELAYMQHRNKVKWRSSMRYISIGAHDLQSSCIISGAQSRQTSITTHTHTHTQTHTHTHTPLVTTVMVSYRLTDYTHDEAVIKKICRKAVQSLKGVTGFGILS